MDPTETIGTDTMQPLEEQLGLPPQGLYGLLDDIITTRRGAADLLPHELLSALVFAVVVIKRVTEGINVDDMGVVDGCRDGEEESEMEMSDQSLESNTSWSTASSTTTTKTETTPKSPR